MDIWELFTVALCLATDAFTVAICKGLSLKKIRLRHCLIVGLYFGLFQALMPLIGYLLADTVAAGVTEYSFPVAFLLLLLIGLNMIREAFSKKEEGEMNDSLSFTVMLPLALATSIDALAVGVSFALVRVDILPAVAIIGLVTLLLSAVGVRLGSLVGQRFRKVATVCGGAVLILLGVKVLLEGLGVI